MSESGHQGMTPKVYTIAAHDGFAAALARGLIAQFDPRRDALALSRATIFLPTRRAARSLSEELVKLLGGAALLPEIRALGDADEDEALFDPSADDLALPPAIGAIRQRLLLAAMVERWSSARGTAHGFAQSAALAKSLADFLFEVQTAGADLAALDTLVPDALAAHWAEVRDFLRLLRDEWPAIIAAENALDPAERRNLALNALAARFADNPPAGPVIAAGSTGSIPATARLLATIARLPQGAVILPDLDTALDEDSWQGLDEGHPQFGLKQLIEAIGITRDAVMPWHGGTSDHSRAELLRQALRPAPTTDAWRALAVDGAERIAPAFDGLAQIEAATPSEEALAIALILRHALETKGCTAALVTPDRMLARRVAAELARWDIAIDDSAGKPLSHTPPGEFLCLLADAAEAEFSPVTLLALLKHPLAACGQTQAEFRRHVRRLDLALRGPKPDAGLASIARTIADDAKLTTWFAHVHVALDPLAQAMAAPAVALDDVLDAHLQAGEALAATQDGPDADNLWRGDAGNALATLFAEIKKAADGLPQMTPSAYPALIRGLIGEKTLRPAYGTHPRLAILGPLEARLQRFDLTVLAGLNEGTWPRAAQSDAWLSRPMRRALGLEQPERSIGRAAHDFATLACAPRVILTRALKADGAPTVASRWWQRLSQLAQGLGLAEQLRKHDGEPDYLAIARALDEPLQRQPPLPRPAPTPPVELRPRSLSVTEIETWLRDPYAIYAKHVLRLRPLEPLEVEPGASERGIAIHRALERFTQEFPGALPNGAKTRLIELALELFDEFAVPRSVRALWLPRFIRAAKWFVGEERARRERIVRSHVEVHGETAFDGPAGPFTLRARADRIDELKEGGGAIVDYKSGLPPSDKQVTTLIAPQLPLEAAMLAAGGFVGVGALAPSELVYIRFSGGAEPGEIHAVKTDAADLAQEAARKLAAHITRFDDPYTPYLPRLIPFSTEIEGDYDHLARVREWSVSGWEGEE